MFTHPLYSFLSALWTIFTLPLFRRDPLSFSRWRENTCSLPNNITSGKGEEETKTEEAFLCAYCSAIDIDSLCRAADNKGSGLGFHPHWHEVKECAKRTDCPLCVFLVQPNGVGIQADGTLFPLGRFNNADRLSDDTKARIKEFVRGRLYVVTDFWGKGLVMLVDEENTLFRYWSLSVGEDNGSHDKYLQTCGLPIRKSLSSTGSEASLNTICQWLSTCSAEHDCYPRNCVSSRCPAARLIDVEAFDPSCPDVRLIETVQAAADTGKYIALSYCWGSSSNYKQLTTTRDTLPSHISRIPFSVLPLTFQHAVRVSRFLGVRHLWIDALCIVQDDPLDWDDQAAKMCAVYAQATLVLAADSASDPSQGVFNERSIMFDEEPLGAHVAVRLPASWSSSAAAAAPPPLVTLYVSTNEAFPSQLDNRLLSYGDGGGTAGKERIEDRDRVLVTRGWTLQEAVLAPRVLHFTSTQLVWECKSCGYESEDGFSVSLRDQRPTFVEVKEMLKIEGAAAPRGTEGEHETVEEHKGKDEEAGVLKEGVMENRSMEITAGELAVLNAWYFDLILLRYSTRNLTFQKDRLPAIAGLSEWTAQALRCDYIAGMWRTGLEWALTWRKASASASCSRPFFHEVKDMASRPGPSFSWVASTGQIHWDYAISTFAPSIRVCALSVELAGSSPFGRIHAGFGSNTWLRAQAWVARSVVLRRKPGTPAFVLPGDILCSLWMDHEYGSNSLDGGGREELKVTLMELGVAAGPPEVAGGGQWWLDQGMARNVCVLVLRELGQAEDGGVFVREGMVDFDWDASAMSEFRKQLRWETVTLF